MGWLLIGMGILSLVVTLAGAVLLGGLLALMNNQKLATQASWAIRGLILISISAVVFGIYKVIFP